VCVKMCETVNLVFRALLAVFLYIAAHEGGHVLAGVATGRTVTSITLVSLKPSVTLLGLSTPGEQAFAAAAGSGLVVSIWLAFMIFRRARGETFTAWAITFFAGIELLAWFVSSLAHRLAPPSNDVTKFLNVSGIEPLLVASLVGVIAVVGAVICAGSFRTIEEPIS
jgi:hypothetical protein